MLILDLWGISFHAVIVFDLVKNLLPKSAVADISRAGVIKLSLAKKNTTILVNGATLLTCNPIQIRWEGGGGKLCPPHTYLGFGMGPQGL